MFQSFSLLLFIPLPTFKVFFLVLIPFQYVVESLSDKILKERKVYRITQ